MREVCKQAGVQGLHLGQDGMEASIPNQLVSHCPCQAEAINSKSEVAQLWRHHHLNPNKRRPVAVPRLSW